MPAGGLHSPCIQHLNAGPWPAFTFKCPEGPRITPHDSIVDSAIHSELSNDADESERRASCCCTRAEQDAHGRDQAISWTYPSVEVTRRVWVHVSGKHFPGLQPAEQATWYYNGTAVESQDKHKFPRPPQGVGRRMHRTGYPVHLRVRCHR